MYVFLPSFLSFAFVYALERCLFKCEFPDSNILYLVLKTGRVVIILKGKYAGKKAVVVKTFDEPTEKKPYAHAIVVGIDRSPLPVTKGMAPKKVAQRSRVRPFIKAVNYNHLMPTRYNLDDIDFKNVVGDDATDPAKRQKIKRKIKPVLEDKYRQGTNKWFFTKLRF